MILWTALQNHWLKLLSFMRKMVLQPFLATTLTSSFDKTQKAIAKATEYLQAQHNQKNRSRLLGIYLEGPYFSIEKKGAQPKEYIRDPDILELDAFIEQAKGNIKVVALAPELKGAYEKIAHLKNEGIVPFVGHSNAKFAEIKPAIETGLRGATHLYNGMRGFSHREPGVVGSVLNDERVVCELICDGVHVHPQAMQLAFKMKGKDGIILVSDSMMATGLNDGEYKLGGQKVIVEKGAARLSDGTLAGSTLTLNKAVQNMCSMVDVPLKDAVRMASLNPAKIIGVSHLKGSIEPGKDADLIILMMR